MARDLHRFAPKPRSDDKILRATRPSLGLEVAYRRRLLTMVEDMATSIEWAVERIMKRERPVIVAMDAAPPGYKINPAFAGTKWSVTLPNGRKVKRWRTNKTQFFDTEADAIKAAEAEQYIAENRPQRPVSPSTKASKLLNELNTLAEQDWFGTAKVTLSDGTIIWRYTTVAGENRYGPKRGKYLQRTYGVMRPGDQTARAVSRSELAALLEDMPTTDYRADKPRTEDPRAAAAKARADRPQRPVAGPEDEPEQPSPADAIAQAMRDMAEQWQAKFDDMAPKLADYFSTAVEDRSSTALRNALREGGVSVRFQMTPGMRNALDASIAENVGLIRSIPQQYLTQVQGMVMRSVQAGRDLGALAKDLRREFDITKRRAALIARDQNNKVTSVMQRARYQEIGITEAIWMHSGGGKKPRPKHVKANGKRYDVSKGLPIGDKAGEWCHPGELINCRCVSRAVVPGFV